MQEPGSYVGEVIKVMSTKKVLCKVNPEGKYVVDLDKDIDVGDLKPGLRVALRNDSYTLHKILPTKVDPLVSLMKVEAVPDSTYDQIGGCDKQIMELKEVRRSGGLERRACKRGLKDDGRDERDEGDERDDIQRIGFETSAMRKPQTLRRANTET